LSLLLYRGPCQASRLHRVILLRSWVLRL